MMIRIAALSAALAMSIFNQSQALQVGPTVSIARTVQAAAANAVPRLDMSGRTSVARQASRPFVRLAERASMRVLPRGTHRSQARAKARPSSGSLYAGGLEQKPGLSYAVSPSISVALGYQFVTCEDLALELGKPASLESDYNSHNVFVRARWQF